MKMRHVLAAGALTALLIGCAQETSRWENESLPESQWSRDESSAEESHP